MLNDNGPHPTRWDECTEHGIARIIAANTVLDGMPWLQWALRREYWTHAAEGHTAAVRACVAYAAERHVTITAEGDALEKAKGITRPRQ